jgi:hypothetical protein
LYLGFQDTLYLGVHNHLIRFIANYSKHQAIQNPKDNH